MSTYEKARDLADKLTAMLRSLPPAPDVPRRTVLPSEVLKRAGEDEIDFYYHKIKGEKKYGR